MIAGRGGHPVRQHVRVRLQRVRPLRAAALAGLLAISGLLVTARDPGAPAAAAAQTPDPVADHTRLAEPRLADVDYFVYCPRADGTLTATPAAGGRTGQPGCRFRAIDPTGGRDRTCGVTVQLLIPECGAWFGIYTKPADTDWAAAVTNIEQQTGRRFDLVSRYHWWTDPLPDEYERPLAAGGRYLRINIRSTDTAGHALRWAAIADGAEDTTIDRHAAALAALGSPVFLSFDQAADLQVDTTSGSAADFIAAWRHLHDRFTAARATNVIWVWTITGDLEYQDRWPALYPGDSYVDWISWTAYNFAGCHHRPSQSPDQIITPMHNWLIGHGYGAKPFMLSGYGTTDRHSAAAWYAGLSDALTHHPNIRAIVAFDSAFPARPDTAVRIQADLCDTRISATPATLAAFAAAGGVPTLNHPLRQWTRR